MRHKAGISKQGMKEGGVKKFFLWSEESTFQLVFEKNGRWIQRAKDE